MVRGRRTHGEHHFHGTARRSMCPLRQTNPRVGYHRHRGEGVGLSIRSNRPKQMLRAARTRIFRTTGLTKQTCKPSSVSARKRTVTIYLAPTLPAGSCGLPGDRPGALESPYLALLRVGFARHPPHGGGGELLPHHFTLTPNKRGGMFLWHFPRVTPPGRYPAPCPVEFGLSSPMPETGSGAATRSAWSVLAVRL